MRISRLLAVMGFALSVLVLVPSPSYACSCVQMTTAEYVDRADVVVRGTIESRTGPPPAKLRSSGDPVTYKVTVAEVYKGSAGTTIEVRSAISGASCGLESIRFGKEYVVFATEGRQLRTRGQLWASLCGGTSRATPALLAEVEASAPGPEPASGPVTRANTEEVEQMRRIDDPVADPPLWPWAAGLLTLVVAGLGAGAAIWRRSR